MELKLNRRELEHAKLISYNQDIILDQADIESERDIISVEKVHFIGQAQYVSDLVILSLKVKANLTLRSTRSLKPVPYVIEDEENLTLTYSQDDILEDSDVLFVEGEDFDLYQEILSMIITSIPMKIIGEDEPTSLSGEGWELISEDDYNNRKSNEIDPRMAKLLDLDLDD